MWASMLVIRQSLLRARLAMTFVKSCGRIIQYFDVFMVMQSIAKSHFYMLCWEHPNGL